jgi:hypothetical protein
MNVNLVAKDWNGSYLRIGSLKRSKLTFIYGSVTCDNADAVFSVPRPSNEPWLDVRRRAGNVAGPRPLR